MNDLRLLYQYDKERKIVNLQYKQIASLDPLIPILNKFQNLQSLSLNGNRLKSLPDMRTLEKLSQLDLSNNLFSDYRQALKGLQSLPNLRHLIYSFKSDQQQNQFKNELPSLERLNKRPVNNKIINKKIKKNQLKLEQKELQQIGQIYDQIRQMYKRSKYMIDKELMTDFDKSVDVIMADLTNHLNSSKSATEIDTSIITCRYGLIDMCFTKVITYFYHFDKSIAVVLQKIHDYIAESFKTIGDIIKVQEQKLNVEISKIKTKKEQLFKNEIKRLRSKDQGSIKQLQFLQQKNNELLRLLSDYAKSNLISKSLIKKYVNNFHMQREEESGLRQRDQNLLDRRGTSGKKRGSFSPLKLEERIITKAQQFDFRNVSKNLTLNQLKQVIADLYACKIKQDKICRQSGQCIQTMQQYMYTYLNQKYGLKNLTIQWAMSIVNGIKRYSNKQPEIAVFGKVLRCQTEELFHEQLTKLKNALRVQIRKFKGQGNIDNGISFNEAEEILLNCRYNRDTIELIVPKLKQQFSASGKVPQQSLQNAVLQQLIRQHDEQIKHFLQIFKVADKDDDGVLNRKELVDMIESGGREVDTQLLFNCVDPFSNDKITFSQLYEKFIKDESYKVVMKKQDGK